VPLGRSLAQDRRVRPRSGAVSSALGLVEASLGRSEEAKRHGTLPISTPGSTNRYRYSKYVENLAVIHALVGEHEQALDRVEELLAIFGGFTVHYMEGIPEFRLLRDHPRYRGIVASSR